MDCLLSPLRRQEAVFFEWRNPAENRLARGWLRREEEKSALRSVYSRGWFACIPKRGVT